MTRAGVSVCISLLVGACPGEPGAPARGASAAAVALDAPGPTPALVPAAALAAPQVAPADPQPSVPVVPVGPVAAFVVVTARATIVAPVDPVLVPVRAAGIWVLDDVASPGTVRFHPGSLGHYPTCACVAAETACGGVVVVGAGEGPVCDCMAPPEVFAEEPEPDMDDGVDTDCESSGSVPVALVGGVLFFHGESHSECGGMNIYDIFSREESMVAAPALLSAPALRFGGCGEGGVGNASPPWPLSDAYCASKEGARDPDCLRCKDLAEESIVYTLHRGQLYRVEDAMDTSGAGMRRWFSREVTAKRCPSAADPCGAATGFPGLEAADDFWVASDGRHALQQTRGELVILGGATPAARGDLGPDAVLGVRWHADARPLIAAMVAREPRPRELAACTGDEGCRGYAGCDLRCEAGACVVNGGAEPVALAAEDLGFVDARGGKDWGLRCLEHLRARRMGAAQAACEAGLAVASKPAIRGALLYNLGLIARKTGATQVARARFGESLVVRPGNAAVLRALAELGPG